GVPVRLGNLTEVRLIALKQRGLIQPGMTSVLVVLEPGAVGCGIVAEGQVLRGAVEASSELGQTWVISRGECVRLEELTEWPHLRDRVRRLGGESPGSLSAFLMGSGEEISAVRGELATDLGRALANLVFLIKPSHLWLTGSLVSQGGPFVESLSTEIHGHLLPAFSKALTIETLDNGPESGVIGAGGLILDLLFAAPVVRYF
ncbi:ROK family protein, partial [Candidatus Sumerlaeota bacterium]|nr:ROK family protein [Candidatus Sumerlaeota bacterium]